MRLPTTAQTSSINMQEQFQQHTNSNRRSTLASTSASYMTDLPRIQQETLMSQSDMFFVANASMRSTGEPLPNPRRGILSISRRPIRKSAQGDLAPIHSLEHIQTQGLPSSTVARIRAQLHNTHAHPGIGDSQNISCSNSNLPTAGRIQRTTAIPSPLTNHRSPRIPVNPPSPLPVAAGRSRPPVTNHDVQTSSRDRSYQKTDGSTTAVSQLVQIANGILTQIVSAREENTRRHLEYLEILKELRDALPSLTSNMERNMAALSRNVTGCATTAMNPNMLQLATLAQNYVKYYALLGMSPIHSSTSLYSSSADSSCMPVRVAAKFAMGDITDCDLHSFFTLPVPLKSGKSSALGCCITDCRKKAHTAARSTLQDILDKRPQATFAPVWVDNYEGEVSTSIVHMTVCGYAFVTMKVGFDLKRKLIGRSSRGDLNPSQQIPWALESLRIDAELEQQERAPAFIGVFQIGNVLFKHRLSDEDREKLRLFIGSLPVDSARSPRCTHTALRLRQKSHRRGKCLRRLPTASTRHYYRHGIVWQNAII
eukprot:IDg1816t1